MISPRSKYNSGRLTARLNNTSANSKLSAGVHHISFDSKKDALLYVPISYNSDKPAPLAVMLHGSGGKAEHGLTLLRGYADERNLILLAPALREYTWDIIKDNNFGPDVIFLDSALDFIFKKFSIDASHVAIGGFSDGASYALCIGLTNGDIFTHVIAFSPGFIYTDEKHGKPAVFISHGTDDNILTITSCSRRIVLQLQKQNYPVNYKEFTGGHDIPVEISTAAVQWFL